MAYFNESLVRASVRNSLTLRAAWKDVVDARSAQGAESAIRYYVRVSLCIHAFAMARLAVALDTFQSDAVADAIARRFEQASSRTARPFARDLSPGERALLTRDFGRALPSYRRPATRFR